jgi:hypothetical protein
MPVYVARGAIMSSQTIKATIMGWIGPTNISATPPLEKFISLGPDAIPVVVDIFSNPHDIPAVREFGTDVYLPILVRLLDHYARQGNNSAGYALFEIANSRIPAWGKYGKEAQTLAYQLAQKILQGKS